MSNDVYDQYADTDPERPLYPKAVAQLSQCDGNAFEVLATVRRALRSVEAPADELEAFQSEAMSGDYDNLLQTAMRWVTVH